MEKQSKPSKAPERTDRGGSVLWSIGIYLCLAAVVICLIFASCTGGAVYTPKESEAPPTSLIGNNSPAPDSPEDGGAQGQDDPSPSPEA